MIILRKLFFDYKGTGLTKKGQNKLAEERGTIAKAARELYRNKMDKAITSAEKREVQEGMLDVIRRQKDKALKKIAKKNMATQKKSILSGLGKVFKKVA